MRWIATLLLMTALSPVALAQSLQTGNITGKVSDNTGARAPGVTVTLTNQATNVVRVVQTNESGLYVISAIPPGTYDLKAELSGFTTVERRAIAVQVGSASRISLTLAVGELSETLEVSANSPLIQT